MQKQNAPEQQQQQQTHHQCAVPPEFPGIVYSTLRFYPEAMAALAQAVRDFYGDRNRYVQPPANE